MLQGKGHTEKQLLCVYLLLIMLLCTACGSKKERYSCQNIPVGDGKLSWGMNADDLVVYLAAGADEKKNLQRVWDSAPTATAYQWECVFEEKYCNVYYLHRDKTNGT